MNQDKDIDIAIVGGGVSGAYAAYRLANGDPQRCAAAAGFTLGNKQRLAIRMFEATDRIGGRLWSYHLPNLPNVAAELGGMCFSHLHQNVHGLCDKELGLTFENCAPYMEPNIQYFRRHRFAFKDYIAPRDPPVRDHYPNVVPYFLENSEKWKFPIMLALDACTSAIGGLEPRMAAIEKAVQQPDYAKVQNLIAELAVFLRTATVGTVPVSDYGFWNLLLEKLSSEAYQLTVQSIDVSSIYRNWNLHDAILGLLVLALYQIPAYRVKDGYQRLPERLVAGFQGLGGELSTQHTLTNVARENSAATPMVALTFDSPRGSVRVRAQRVILALPRDAILRLDSDAFLLQDECFKAELDTVRGWPASKLFLSYDRPWWRALYPPIKSGYSSSGLPIGTSFYIGSEQDGQSLLLASMSDGLSTRYWDGYLGADQSARGDAFVGQWGSSIPAHLRASQRMVDEAQRQLQLAHGAPIPTPNSGIYFNWGRAPFGSAWHLWKPHVRSWEVIPKIRRTVAHSNVFLCGEAYSNKQAWAEGAVNSAEMLLQTQFGLPRPDWVSPSYDFGP